MEAPKSNKSTEHSVEDFSDTPFHNLLLRLPKELAERHISHILNENYNDEEAASYLESVLQDRREATTVTEFSDTNVEKIFGDQKSELIEQLDTTVFSSTENEIGYGTTAKIKEFIVANDDKELSMAIKYVVTPNERTVPAAIEHNILHEVERIKNVEEIEKNENFKYMNVPHPYFHHESTSVQCYGMQLIDGLDFFEIDQIMERDEFPTDLIEVLANIDLETLGLEIDLFFSKMHTYCLHGDIKRRNIMFDRTGRVYVIDFGQSELVTNIPDSARDQLENQRAKEVQLAKDITEKTITKAKSLLAQAVA